MSRKVEIISHDWTREVRLYLSVEDVAEIVGVDPARISVSHVDRAPDREDKVVRVCLLEADRT